ncbi:MAG: hypothetical protein N3C12_08950 [Candidatus Binatia bacterium]|nr:hypothetical protein [Candidatus Binatia bacterium]
MNGTELSRRQFLRFAGLTSSWLALAHLGLPAATAAAATWRSAYRLRVFGGNEAAVLAAVMERMVRGDDDSLPPVRKTHAVETVDWALTFAPAELQGQARWLLRIFNWSPPWMIWKPAWFVNLSEVSQDRCLQAWAESSQAWLRTGFLALKNLSVLGYYSQDETWAAIHYRGPWVPRPRRVGWALDSGEAR